LGLFYNIQFTPKGEVTSIPKGGKENYIKILSTMYKIIVDFIEKEKPNYVGISSLDGNKNYHTVYNRLTDNSSNLIPGYFRKDSNLEFNSPQGKGRFIVLKRKENLNENATYSSTIDYKQRIKDLTKYMLDKGMNIKPLPKVIFKHAEKSNAQNFLGKTAYYDPTNQEIVLYTEGRHPRDIVASFCHELIHHIQNLEGRLDNIQTTNTQEDDNLNDIEAEANLKGTMTFRNWTDSINEAKKPYKHKYGFDDKLGKDPFGLNQYARELAQTLETKISSTEKNPELEKYRKQIVKQLKDSKIGTQIKKAVEDIIGKKAVKGVYAIGSVLDPEKFHEESDIDVAVLINVPNMDVGVNEKMSYEMSQTYTIPDGGFIDVSVWNISKPSGKIMKIDETKDGKSSPYGSGYEELKEGKYDSFVNVLSKKAFSFFKKIYKKGNKTGTVTYTVGPKDSFPDIVHNFFEFDFEIMLDITDDTYKVDGGSNSGIDGEGEEITPLLRVNFQIPQNPDWQEVSFDLKDVIRHELEHLTQDGLNAKPGKPSGDDMSLRNMINLGLLSGDNYFKLEKEVDAMLQGLYLKAKKSKKPFLDVIDKYFDQQNMTKQERKEILKIWRDRAKDLSLPLKENKTTKYQIYSDMDGVLTDFDERFKKYSNGVSPAEYENTYGSSNFWELISEQGVRFWVGMPWIEDGKQYWDYIKQYNPILLSSPSTENESRLGKRLWVKNNLPGTKLILARAKNKQNYSDENKILIDDKLSNIKEWRSQGGIGILHTSANKTIEQLKKLGL